MLVTRVAAYTTNQPVVICSLVEKAKIPVKVIEAETKPLSDVCHMPRFSAGTGKVESGKAGALTRGSR